MPKYTYKCKECNEVVEVIHSMSEYLTDCGQCNTIESLIKIPHQIATKFRDKETGKVVDSYIEETKEKVREEKRRLQEQDWNID